MANSIIVLGSVNTDLVIRARRLPAPGETVLGGQYYRAAGGKGANQAVAAVRAGTAPVIFLAAVGDDDFGRTALDGFRREGLACDFIETVQGQPSGVALIMVDEAGENCISVAPGANEHLRPKHVDRVPDRVFQDAGVFLACLESPLPAVIRGLQRARAAGLMTILNPAPACQDILRDHVLPMVDVVTPNANEATALTGIEVVDADSAARAGRALRQLGCQAAIVTLGRNGAVLVGGQTEHVPALPADAVDATAAGDAFNGALAAALAEGRSLPDAARFATIAAGLSVTRQGAQPSLPYRHEIEAKSQAT